MQKDSAGHIGFVFKQGKITAIVKDSSAARNGVLTEHQLVEVNGQNVVGLKVWLKAPDSRAHFLGWPPIIMFNR